MVKSNEKPETESTFRMSFMALMLKEILYTVSTNQCDRLLLQPKHILNSKIILGVY